MKIPTTGKQAAEQAQQVIKSFPQKDYNLAAEYDAELSSLAASIYTEMLFQSDKVKAMKVIKVALAAAYLLGRKGRQAKRKRGSKRL